MLRGKLAIFLIAIFTVNIAYAKEITIPIRNILVSNSNPGQYPGLAGMTKSNVNYDLVIDDGIALKEAINKWLKQNKEKLLSLLNLDPNNHELTVVTLQLGELLDTTYHRKVFRSDSNTLEETADKLNLRAISNDVGNSFLSVSIKKESLPSSDELLRMSEDKRFGEAERDLYFSLSPIRQAMERNDWPRAKRKIETVISFNADAIKNPVALKMKGEIDRH